MTHTKFLLRRLAYVPWLLIIGLVLGWNGEAVADNAGTNETNHNQVTDHKHATDPYLDVKYKLTDTVNDTVFVSWRPAYSKGFHATPTATAGNGIAATNYQLLLFKGEVPVNIAGANGGNDLTVTGVAQFGSPDKNANDYVGIRSTKLVLDLEDTDGSLPDTGPGFYWVRMQVQVPDADDANPTSNPLNSFFAKQIVVEPDYLLSLEPGSVREDVNRTVNIEAKVKVSDDTAVTKDITVPLALGIGQDGLNERFGIVLPTVTLRKGQKEATGTIRFTPIVDPNNPTPDDDLIVNIKTTGSTVGGTDDIRLIDADKTSTAINLSFSKSTLSRDDGSTDITVTATLNGKVVNQAVRVALIIDEDESTATRDVDYTATIRPVNIPRRRVSGTATINIRPNANAEAGSIWLKASTNPVVDGNTIVVNPGEIEISEGPSSAGKGLTATPYSIREDAGTRDITLEVSLQNALLKDEIVTFAISNDEGLGAQFDEAEPATRDVDYRATVQSLTIPKGQTKGTTIMTVTPINNNDQDGLRFFKVTASVGGSAGILITDDDTTSKSITLEVNPTEITEDAGATVVTVTGTLNGKTFKDNVIVSLIIDDDINGDGNVNADDGAAQRDLDYTASLSPLVIPAGAIAGATTITISPIANDGKEGDEKIGLNSSGKPKARDDDDVEEELDVIKTAITLKDTHEDGTTPTTPDPTQLAFADSISSQTYTVGTAITDLVLPEATGGTAPLTYIVSTLPAGLSFSSATRTLSGIPTQATATSTIFYTVVDSTKASDVLIFTITVEEGQLPPPVADAELAATPSSVRENIGTEQVELKVTLAAARATNETVTFTIVAPSEGKQAVRDVDYTASLEPSIVSIPAGATIGRATLTLSPINNTSVDSLRSIGVRATFASGAMLTTDIKIVDDETPSTGITLSADPHTIIEGSGKAEVTVTATLNGKALDAAATVVVAIDPASSATRDVDYAALFNPVITIPAGAQAGATQFEILTIADDLAEGDETIKLIGLISGLTGGEVEITVSDPVVTTPEPPVDPPDSTTLSFADTIATQEYTVGTAITPLVLPEATGGAPPMRYFVLPSLPTGLSFDSATRTISGTPTAETNGAFEVIYIVFDSNNDTAELTFSITVSKKVTIDLSDLFGSGKIVPTAAPNGVSIREFVVGQYVDGLVLPAGSGGRAPLTYSLSPALPAGLTFDATTRTISGTPQAASEAVYTYTVTDANGASASLMLQTLPAAFSLADNFPNPFNPATTIQYALPLAADVELTVYNVVGQVVRTLVAEHQGAGRYTVEWDATDDSGHSVSAGLYLYRLQAGGEFAEVKKMLLLK